MFLPSTTLESDARTMQCSRNGVSAYLEKKKKDRHSLMRCVKIAARVNEAKRTGMGRTVEEDPLGVSTPQQYAHVGALRESSYGDNLLLGNREKKKNSGNSSFSSFLQLSQWRASAFFLSKDAQLSEKCFFCCFVIVVFTRSHSCFYYCFLS